MSSSRSRIPKELGSSLRGGLQDGSLGQGAAVARPLQMAPIPRLSLVHAGDGKNHVVTRGHLALFSRRRSCEMPLRRRSLEGHLACQRRDRTDFYVIKDGDGRRDSSWERAMGTFEATAVPALRRVRDWPLTSDDRCALSEYIALLALRSPAFRAWHAETTRVFSMRTNEAGATGIDGCPVGYGRGVLHWASALARHNGADAVADRKPVGSTHWTSMRFSSARCCISDHPVVAVPLAKVGEVKPFVLSRRRDRQRDRGENARRPASCAPSDLARRYGCRSPRYRRPRTAAGSEPFDRAAGRSSSVSSTWWHATARPSPTVPLSMRLIEGYRPAAAYRSTRRETALQIVNGMIAKGGVSDTMRFVTPGSRARATE